MAGKGLGTEFEARVAIYRDGMMRALRFFATAALFALFLFVVAGTVLADFLEGWL
jgi:hypothetical protein